MACQAQDTILSLTTTVAHGDDAHRLARALLEARLAACVQVEPGLQAHYRWQGAVLEEPELRLTVKTRPEALPALLAFLGERHPYEVPQLVWQAMQASPAYAAWVRSGVDVAEPAG